MHTRINIRSDNSEQKEILIALLADAGFDGFEEQPGSLSAFIEADAYDEGVLNDILGGFELTFHKENIPERNWNAEWEKDFVPVTVNQFCAVRAGFHPPVPDVKHDIIVTPRMSFGTGHHATTWLVLSGMEPIDFQGKTVLDYGTGTGVLAILAEKLGATRTLAIDNDKWSIENAADNFSENECTGIELVESSEIETTEQFDVILANINRNVLLARMQELAQHLKKDGVLLMSGLLAGDQEIISEKANSCKLTVKSAREREGWIVLEVIHS
ncbi:MAG: 50S ribosomal protein L11 methyltransferase [Chitinophagaceae bacterium]|nr:MAG: 50S ribosomal protein L11 methyltransferase [Chitinophagaceae bacterium]